MLLPNSKNLKTNSYIYKIFTFCYLLLLILLLFFFLQQYIFGKSTLLLLSYVVNLALAILIFAVLLKLSQKHTHLLGFVFLGGSLLKFIIYFIFFHPVFRSDNLISKTETFTFLIPYFICLFYETFYLVRMLNKANHQN